MKPKIPLLLTLSGLMIFAFGVGYVVFHNKPVIKRQSPQFVMPAVNGDRSVSIPKGTILLLLAVGVIGALSVRRQNKNSTGSVRHNRSHASSANRHEALIKLTKRYLNLQYRITQHKFSGSKPPDNLRKEIADLERKVRLISRPLD